VQCLFRTKRKYAEQPGDSEKKGGPVLNKTHLSAASSRPVRPASNSTIVVVVRKSRLRDFVRDVGSAVQEMGMVATARFCQSPPNPRRGRVLGLRMQVPGTPRRKKSVCVLVSERAGERVVTGDSGEWLDEREVSLVNYY
jgi:hypothetical protein